MQMTMTTTTTTTLKQIAHRSGTFLLDGKTPVHRLGFGAMRITGRGIWGEPDDRDEALRTLRRLPELGVDFIDTPTPTAQTSLKR